MNFPKYKYFFLFIFLTIIGSQINCQASIWLPKASYPGNPRQFAVGFSIGLKGYLGTGYDNTTYRKDFYEYDPATNTWTKKLDFGGVPRILAVGFSIGNKGYICTGQDVSGRLKDHWEYDPTLNTWTKKADFAGLARREATAFSVGSKGYVGTGYENSGNTYMADFWEYDPALNKWTKKTDFAGGARHKAVSFSIGSKGYIGTGFDGSANKNDFWEYDPATDIWLQKADVDTAIWLGVGFSIGSKGYLGIGYSSSNPLKSFWEYDPGTNKWTKETDFAGTARFGAVGFSIGIKGYVGTGYDISSLKMNDFWEFQPTYILTGSISATNICISTTSSYSINVPYTILTTFNAGNIFTAQLSDSSGSFASPKNIGTKISTNAGTISASIPANTKYGYRYRIRVISSDPSCIGLDNKKDLSLNPKPIAAFTIDDNIQCLLGNKFNFSNTSTVPIGVITQTMWNFGDAGTGINLNTNHSYSNDGSFSVLMTTVTDSGCSDTLTKFVTVLPAPNASFSASDTALCFKANTFTFTNLTTIKSGTLSYKWYTGNNDSSTSTNLIYSYPNPGKFNLKLIAASNLGCFDTATKLIQLDSLPIINFTINDTTQCSSLNNFVFTDNSKNAQSYFWKLGDGDTSTSKIITHTYSSDNTFNVELKVFSNPACFDSMIKKVYVYPSPVASFSVNKDTQCLSINAFVFSNLSTIVSGSINSLWYFGDGNSSINANHTYSLAQTFNVSVVVTSDKGCKDSFSKPVVVTQTAFLTKTKNSGPVCEGQPLDLFTDSINLALYSWTGPGGFNSTNQNPNIAITNASHTGNYQVTATVNGCTSLPSITNVLIKPIPDSPQVQSNIQVCEGAVINLDAYLPDSATYFWTGPFGFTSAYQNTIINKAKLSNGGNYHVKATVKGCEGPYSNVMVSINRIPNINLGKDTNLCKGDVVTLDPGIYKSYLWSDNSTNEKFTVKDRGKYWVEVTSVYNCVGSDTITFTDLCFPTFYAPTAFSPNDDYHNDIFIPQGNNIFDFIMQIYNKWGVEIFETNTIDKGWDGKFNGTDCPVDLYYWHATWYSIWEGEDKHKSQSGGVYLTR